MSSHQTYTKMYYHLVWSTKNRHPFITKENEETLYNYIGRITIEKKWHLLEIGGIYNHVHILLQKSPRYTISEVVRCIKSNSSTFMREKFNPNFAWQAGYSAFTVDKLSLLRLKKYILNQKQHHDAMSFEKEFDLLLERYD